MSDSHKEHRPLLREDCSDEELQQEFRPTPCHMGYRGRARNTVKGAATVIKNWPDYLSSSVNYSYVSIGMFALITFILYSSVLTYSMLPATGSKPIPQYVSERKSSTLPEVFMHVIVNSEKEIDLNKYLPYVEIIADKYLHYQFNLIFMMNDTHKPEQAVQIARKNNQDAMNSLWAEHNVLAPVKVPSKTKSNIMIQHVSLLSYLNGTPIQQFWNELPNQLIEFLARAVSIWDKGGIAISPIILTPRSPHPIYIEKLYSLLSSYEKNRKPNSTTNVSSKMEGIKSPKIMNNHKRKYRKKVNNIRDIIDALETDAHVHENQAETLSAAEDRQEMTKTELEPSKTKAAFKSNNHKFNRTSKLVMDSNQIVNKKSKLNQSIEHNQPKISNYYEYMPSVFNFLFHDESNKTTKEESADPSFIKRITRTISTESTQEHVNKGNVIQPMIISAPAKFDKIPSNVRDNASSNNDVENLTIDLKGYILATKTSCHAFLGSVFGDVKHGAYENSLKEFIIGELSLFCNGLLSTCKGVDVILL